MLSMWDSVKAKWAAVDAWVDEKTQNKEGKPNALGLLWKVATRALWAPVAALATSWKIAKLSFTAPEKAWDELRYQAWRASQVFGALFGVYKIYDYIGDDADGNPQYTEGRWEFRRAIFFGYMWAISSIFVGPFMQAGWTTLGMIFLLAPPAAWVIGGVSKAYHRWAYASRELYFGLRALDKAEERILAHQERQAAVQGQKQAARTLDRATQDAEQLKLEEKQARALALEASERNEEAMADKAAAESHFDPRGSGIKLELTADAQKALAAPKPNSQLKDQVITLIKTSKYEEAWELAQRLASIGMLSEDEMAELEALVELQKQKVAAYKAAAKQDDGVPDATIVGGTLLSIGE